ncbi:MAG: aminotransferase class I/II-fold pyridoxal phosphate-dependent enzyme [Lachnospiraceae bacterium]|nr:aminotransferase class I/II-fold pyridoxal phosphate-dependent enzyme [Lachnospiraceae bacterium]
MNLVEFIRDYTSDEYIPFHMPGHKRKFDMVNPYLIDITEIDGFDNYHNPQEIFLNEQKLLKEMYKTDYSWYLVNGSTVGILAAISATTNRGDTVLVARNSHKSVYNAILLQELKAKYVYPKIDENSSICREITIEDIKNAFADNKNIRVVVITSPTYEGVVSDIEAIADFVHSKNAVLIVDEAHGAHFGFNDTFLKSAIELGADIVVQSWHKTLPSLTQTAIIHVKGGRVDIDMVKKYLSIYQSSSPSYVLLASMFKCREFLQTEGAFDEYVDNLVKLRQMLKEKLNRLVLFESDDISKLVITTTGTNLNGRQLYDRLLKDYKIQLEMAGCDYIVAMTSVCDTKEAYDTFLKALIEIDASCEYNKKVYLQKNVNKIKPVCTIFEVFKANVDKIPYNKAINKISADFVYAYPPGIPIIAPGEEVTAEIIELINFYKTNDLELIGLIEDNIKVVKDV